MIEYQATCTTNAFRVTSIEDLKDELTTEGFTVVTDDHRFGLGLDVILLEVNDETCQEVTLYADGEAGMWPDLYDCITEEEHGGLSGVAEAVANSLQSDSVAVFNDVAPEEQGLAGYTVAVSANGKVLESGLRDILDVAQGAFAGTTARR